MSRSRLHRILILTSLFLPFGATIGLASDAHPPENAESAHGETAHGEAAHDSEKPEEKAPAKASEKSAAKPASDGHGAPNAALSTAPQSYYKHTWKELPALSGENLFDRQKLTYTKQAGVAQLVVFVASWCIPCQTLLPEIRRLESSFNPRFIKVRYVFSHDLIEDALAFAKAYGLTEAILADHEALKQLSNPPLPSLYLSDRNGWILMRQFEPKIADLSAIQQAVRYLSVF